VYPYVAFLHDHKNPRAEVTAQRLIDRFRQAHQHWVLFDESKGLSVFHAPPRGRSVSAIMLPFGGGVLLGTIFHKDLRAPLCHPNPVIDSVEEIRRTRGRYLMTQFWGGYVAFLTDCDGSVHIVLRDCSGKIPCYVISREEVTIVASNIEDLEGLPLPSFSMNSRYLAGFLHAGELAHRECALNEVKELLAGECLEIDGDRARQFALWDPRSICREYVIEDFEDACRQVRNVTQACVDLWASKYDRIVHHLSGGLDSSVVLGCLRRSMHRPLVTCLHLESSGAGETERAFAQLAAGEAGMDLVVQSAHSEHAKYDERILRLPRAPKPSVAHLGFAIDSDLRNLLPSRMGADATWDGQGGDHLFFESRAPFPAVDYAFCHGMTGDFSRRVLDSIRLSRLSFWSVLGKATRLGLLGRPWCPEDERRRETMFLNRELICADIADYAWQPWSADSSDLPPGKRLQIGLLGRLIHRHRPIPGLQYAEDHHPLFSQPLLELCLRIPIYVLLRGGINRALERVAFEDCVPRAVIRRENKGTVATSLMSRIRESMPFVRGLILDGVLVRERIIERSTIEPYVVGNRPLSLSALWPFLSCLAAEVWARRWADSAWRL
jgi:asparagine synthase (glutamine-hydrolysing)